MRLRLGEAGVVETLVCLLSSGEAGTVEERTNGRVTCEDGRGCSNEHTAHHS